MYTIRSTECDYRSEREEPFYIITAEIKNKPTLEDSFQLFVEPELLSGDNKIQVVWLTFMTTSMNLQRANPKYRDT